MRFDTYQDFFLLAFSIYLSWSKLFLLRVENITVIQIIENLII